MSREATLEVIDHILPEYPRISAAPDGSAVMGFTPMQRWEESRRRYKAVSEGGDVLLIQNPVVWHVMAVNGVMTFIQLKPQLKMTRAEVAKAASGKKHADRMYNQRGDDFNVERKSPWNEEDTEKVRQISRAGRRRRSDHDDF